MCTTHILRQSWWPAKALAVKSIKHALFYPAGFSPADALLNLSFSQDRHDLRDLHSVKVTSCFQKPGPSEQVVKD